MSKNTRFTTKTITSCAILIALGVIVARLISFAPSEFSRFSIESVPIFLAGAFFGPIAGALVGFATDFIGCLFSPYGFNPIFCVPPILYGLCGSLGRILLAKKVTILRVALSLLPAVVLGSILWQSFALGLISGNGFLFYLGTRSVQFAVVLVLDTVLLRLLLGSRVFSHTNLWPPKGRA